jgi:hypothetical protein
LVDREPSWPSAASSSFSFTSSASIAATPVLDRQPNADLDALPHVKQ